MPDPEKNNLPAENLENGNELDDEFIPEDAWPVCPDCLKPCNPLQNYCDGCGSNQVINPLAAYMPFVNIRFNYGGFCTMWRKIWYSEDTAVMLKGLYLFVIIIFVPVIFVLAHRRSGPTLARLGSQNNVQRAFFRFSYGFSAVCCSHFDR